MTDKDREEARKFLRHLEDEGNKTANELFVADTFARIRAEIDARWKEVVQHLTATNAEFFSLELARIRAEAKADALAAMAPCIGAYESALKDKAGECTWTEDPEGYWSTSCGRSWTFIEGGPIENEINHCHGCGKHVHIADEPKKGE